MRILGIPGSLRSGSHSRELLRIAADLAPPPAELELWEGLRAVPPFDADDEDTPAAVVVALRQSVSAADAVLISTPEYNGSIPGQLKNALDWASRPVATNPFRNKPVAVVSASTGSFGGVWAQAELKKVLGLMGARVVPTELAVPKAHERLNEPDDELLDGVATALAALVAELEPASAAA